MLQQNECLHCCGAGRGCRAGHVKKCCGGSGVRALGWLCSTTPTLSRLSFTCPTWTDCTRASHGLDRRRQKQARGAVRECVARTYHCQSSAACLRFVPRVCALIGLNVFFLLLHTTQPHNHTHQQQHHSPIFFGLAPSR